MKIELKNDSFEWNGTQWHVTDDVTIGRLPDLEKMLHHFVNGVDIVEQQIILTEIYNDMNNMKFADAARKLHNMANATNVKKHGMHNPKLLIATMFINRPGEDVTKWSMDIANEKIKAWEGAPSSFFFKLAEQQLTDILQRIFGISQTISEALLKVGEARQSPAMEIDQSSTIKSKTKSKKNG